MKLQVNNPSNGKLIQTLNFQTTSDVNQALEIAQLAHQQNPRGLPPHERIEILKSFQAILIQNQTQLIKCSTEEGGKPHQDTVVEFQRAVQGVEIAIQSIAQLHGQEIPMGLTPSSVHKMAFTTTQPIGVVVAISAFNHPINLIIHQVITAVAAGCPVIVKPSLTTPLVCLKLIELLHQAKLPKEFAQCLILENSLAEKLAIDSRVHFLTFIGSYQVGWKLRSLVAPGTRVALEHGGIAPAIITPSAELDSALPAITKGAFYHAGQVCVSVQRLFVHHSILPLVLDQLKILAQNLVVGDASNSDTEVGPLITSEVCHRVHHWVEEAQQEGAQLICGGLALSEFFYKPTILLNPSLTSKVSQQEIFGPVLCVYSYDTLAEAIQTANDTPFHFQASIFTQNLKEVNLATQTLNAKTVLINEHSAFRVDWMPFGGNDHSGLGTGGILQSMRDMSREKLIILNQ